MKIGEELKRIRLLNGKSARQFAGYIGLDADRLRKWEANGVNPKDDDVKKIEDYFQVGIDDLGTINKFKFSSKLVPGMGNLRKQAKEPGENEKSLHILVESNRILSEAQKITSENQKILLETNSKIASSNSELASALKLLAHKATGNIVEDIPEAYLTKLAQMLVFVAEVGVGKNWPTLKDGIDILHKRFYENPPASQAGDIESDEHKQNKKIS